MEPGIAPRAQPGLNMRVFVDTKIWVYRLDQREAEKRQFTKSWLRQVAQDHEIVISTQVLIELRSVMARKLQPSISTSEARKALEALTGFEVVPTDAALVLDAHELAAANQIAWFDALILEAAIRSHCSVLYSEDFNVGQHFGDLEILNPIKNS
jgi:predicted nucleic acid-binding protein